jgi:proline racemase
VSGRLAILRARSELELGEPVDVESIVGGRFVGRIVEEARVGGLPAVIPEIEGRAYLTGRHEFWIDPVDPMAHGFLLR